MLKKKGTIREMKGLGNKEGIQKGRWENPKKKKKRDFLLSFNDRGLALCEDVFFFFCDVRGCVYTKRLN